MSGAVPCRCVQPVNKGELLEWMGKHWVVVDRRCNYSAFSGYHRTPSDYSAIRCTTCGGVWRTKAKYVDWLDNEESNTNRGG